jgi:hypothetical protein
LVLALPAGAQQPLRLSIQDGHVTLHAQNVTVRSILAEWSRIGGTTIVNGERIPGGPVTLELNGVPEREAIDILLRSAAGYVLGARASAAGGASAFDRILVLPISVAPRATAAAPAFAPAGRPGLPLPNGDDDPQVDSQEPRPPGFPTRAVPVRPSGQPNVPQQFGQIAPQPEPDTTQPGNEPRVLTIEPRPGNPFGVPAGSSAAPGVVTPVPSPGQTPQQRDPD